MFSVKLLELYGSLYELLNIKTRLQVNNQNTMLVKTCKVLKY